MIRLACELLQMVSAWRVLQERDRAQQDSREAVRVAARALDAGDLSRFDAARIRIVQADAKFNYCEGQLEVLARIARKEVA